MTTKRIPTGLVTTMIAALVFSSPLVRSADRSDPAAAASMTVDPDLEPIPEAEVERLRGAMRTAQPGAVILLRNGIWRDVEIVFDSSGAEGRPITLKAEQPGKAVFMGRSSITIAGKHLVVEGVVFTGETDTTQPPITFARDSEHCRLTQSAVADFGRNNNNRFHYLRVGGKSNRVDHCLFAGKVNMGPVLAASGGTHARIDYNLIRNNELTS